MTDRERELVGKLYDLQVELFEIQGEEIEALRQANHALARSHEVIGKMLHTTAELIGKPTN